LEGDDFEYLADSHIVPEDAASQMAALILGYGHAIPLNPAMYVNRGLRAKLLAKLAQYSALAPSRPGVKHGLYLFAKAVVEAYADGNQDVKVVLDFQEADTTLDSAAYVNSLQFLLEHNPSLFSVIQQVFSKLDLATTAIAEDAFVVSIVFVTPEFFDSPAQKQDLMQLLISKPSPQVSGKVLQYLRSSPMFADAFYRIMDYINLEHVTTETVLGSLLVAADSQEVVLDMLNDYVETELGGPARNQFTVQEFADAVCLGSWEWDPDILRAISKSPVLWGLASDIRSIVHSSTFHQNLSQVRDRRKKEEEDEEEEEKEKETSGGDVSEEAKLVATNVQAALLKAFKYLDSKSAALLSVAAKETRPRTMPGDAEVDAIGKGGNVCQVDVSRLQIRLTTGFTKLLSGPAVPQVTTTAIPFLITLCLGHAAKTKAGLAKGLEKMGPESTAAFVGATALSLAAEAASEAGAAPHTTLKAAAQSLKQKLDRETLKLIKRSKSHDPATDVMPNEVDRLAWVTNKSRSRYLYEHRRATPKDTDSSRKLPAGKRRPAAGHVDPKTMAAVQKVFPPEDLEMASLLASMGLVQVDDPLETRAENLARAQASVRQDRAARKLHMKELRRELNTLEAEHKKVMQKNYLKPSKLKLLEIRDLENAIKEVQRKIEALKYALE
jgi:hypothetical protein